jgi:sialidase-1
VFESQVLMSDDHGHSWRYSKPTAYGGENTIAEWTDGSVLMFIRNRGWPNEVGFKRYTISYDGGNTWEPTTLTETEMKEPVCHAKLFFHETGGPSGEPAFLFMQPDVDAKGRWDKTSRRKLTVFVSTDGGETWPIHRIAHEGTASYSDLDLIDDHTLASVFEIGAGEEKEWGGQVVFARMPLSWVLEGTGYEPPQPFSEKVFDFYTTLRAPIEEWWKE